MLWVSEVEKTDWWKKNPSDALNSEIPSHAQESGVLQPTGSWENIPGKVSVCLPCAYTLMKSIDTDSVCASKQNTGPGGPFGLPQYSLPSCVCMRSSLVPFRFEFSVNAVRETLIVCKSAYGSASEFSSVLKVILIQWLIPA